MAVKILYTIEVAGTEDTPTALDATARFLNSPDLRHAIRVLGLVVTRTTVRDIEASETELMMIEPGDYMTAWPVKSEA